MKQKLYLPLFIWGFILLAGCFNESDPVTGEVQSILDGKITLSLADEIIQDTQVITLSSEEKVILADSATRIFIKKDGETEEASLDAIQTGDILAVTADEDNRTAIKIELKLDWTVQSNSLNLPKQIPLSGSHEVADERIESTGEAYHSKKADENAILLKKSGVLSANQAIITKSGNTTSEEKSRHYGLNTAVAAINGGAANLEGSSIQSDGEGGIALFTSGKNSIIRLHGTSILTTGGAAKGLYAANQGTITGQDIRVTTEGAHSAAAVADGNSGTITLYDSTLTTSGEDSPCLYSAGTIKASGVIGLANSSPAAVIEGKNSIILSSSDLTGVGNYGILLHESRICKAEKGITGFTAKNSLLSATQDQAMFYVTKTEAEVSLANTELAFESGILIKAEKAGNLTFKAAKQTLTGEIICDETSTISLELKEESFFKGSVDTGNTGSAIIVLDEGSSWRLTEDSYISILSNEQTDCRNIKSNGHTLYYDADEEENGWLSGDTIPLPGGGKLTPAP
ncbi:MAG: hypothetical protein ACI4R6_04455 [Lachnospiraceae bacterium]